MIIYGVKGTNMEYKRDTRSIGKIHAEYTKLGLGLRYSFPKRQILDSSKLKAFAEDNFKFNENGRKLSKRVENTVGKG